MYNDDQIMHVNVLLTFNTIFETNVCLRSFHMIFHKSHVYTFYSPIALKRPTLTKSWIRYCKC